ncbi:MAG: hypothetical protein LQ340_001663 [Diploschistes diacapsis]|nr:MAG: hypothetical protein LQ340_001663 [Diploschistes diacapsis]
MADNAADVSSSSSAGEQQQRHNAYSHDYRDQNGQGAQRDESKSLTELEREVLDEYVKLRENLDKLSPILANLAQNPTAGILDGLRLLERKTSLVSTLLKASVYSIVLQQEMFEGAEGTEGGVWSDGGSSGM